jgi:NAD+ synthase (glutamine-hydrolysing)
MTAVERQFGAIHDHGFVRVAACTPLAATSDPMTNAASIIAQAQEGDAAGIDLMLFPELCISSYAIDDLHLQDGPAGRH